MKTTSLMFISLAIATCCKQNGISELSKIKELVNEVEDIGDSRSIVLTNDLLIVNGGEPPKYFDSFGLEINSVFEKDIVLIQFMKKDTFGMKIKMNDFLRDYYINCNRYAFIAGDTLIVRRVDKRNIVIE